MHSFSLLAFFSLPFSPVSPLCELFYRPQKVHPVFFVPEGHPLSLIMWGGFPLFPRRDFKLLGFPTSRSRSKRPPLFLCPLGPLKPPRPPFRKRFAASLYGSPSLILVGAKNFAPFLPARRRLGAFAICVFLQLGEPFPFSSVP